MFVTTKEMLDKATREGYAVGAFNAENAEMVWAIVAAAEEMNSPVIIQTTSSTLKYFTPAYFAGIVRAAAEAASVPVALHLDHGSSTELARRCIDCGYTSVMIDGSNLPFAENMALAAEVSRYAATLGIPVEAELGTIGGKEDETEGHGTAYTDPTEAKTYVEGSSVSSLAVAIGTAHGFYAVAPVLDLDRITLIRGTVSIPLVLHGASGLSDEVVSRAASLGIAKVNFATELRAAYTKAVRDWLTSNPDTIDPKQYGTAARLAVKQLVIDRIRVCGCNEKA